MESQKFFVLSLAGIYFYIATNMDKNSSYSGEHRSSFWNPSIQEAEATELL